MKKIHVILLITTLILASFSVYSLAAINQVYKIDFEWYSEYSKNFSDQGRAAFEDKWILNKLPKNMGIEVYSGNNRIDEENGNLSLLQSSKKINYQNDILIYCSLGKVNSPEYRIKVIGIAQRGNVVEIKMSFNSPVKVDFSNNHTYIPIDIIKIRKDSFVIKGKLFFIFKNQSGNKIFEKSYII